MIYTICSNFKVKELNPGDILQTYSQGLFVVLNKIIYKDFIVIYWLSSDQIILKIEYQQ